MSDFLISCDTCVMDGSADCADCVVTHLLSPAPREAVVLNLAEVRAMRLLAEAGMVPTLRHREAT
ncbi:MAG: hypothetical protein Q7V57_15225 [Actinomycetota bacterium]|nr:hypothetical protein [Actinomycetota bacterium]